MIDPLRGWNVPLPLVDLIEPVLDVIEALLIVRSGYELACDRSSNLFEVWWVPLPRPLDVTVDQEGPAVSWLFIMSDVTSDLASFASAPKG